MSHNIKQKLQGIQSSLKAPKGQTNKFGGYKYRSCEDILTAVKPLLAEWSCSLVITDEIVLFGNTASTERSESKYEDGTKTYKETFEGRVYVKANACLLDNDSEDSISVSGFAREAESKKGMDEAQITGSASSYARKYALNGLFAIDDTKDPDATNTHGKSPSSAPAQAGF